MVQKLKLKLLYQAHIDKQVSDTVKSINKRLSSSNKPLKPLTFFRTKTPYKWSQPQMLCIPILVNNAIIVTLVTLCVTHINKHLKGRPIPSEVSLHTHMSIKTVFTIISKMTNVKMYKALTICAHTGVLINEWQQSTLIGTHRTTVYTYVVRSITSRTSYE